MEGLTGLLEVEGPGAGQVVFHSIPRFLRISLGDCLEDRVMSRDHILEILEPLRSDAGVFNRPFFESAEQAGKQPVFRGGCDCEVKGDIGFALAFPVSLGVPHFRQCTLHQGHHFVTGPGGSQAGALGFQEQPEVDEFEVGAAAIEDGKGFNRIGEHFDVGLGDKRAGSFACFDKTTSPELLDRFPYRGATRLKPGAEGFLRWETLTRSPFATEDFLFEALTNGMAEVAHDSNQRSQRSAGGQRRSSGV